MPDDARAEFRDFSKNDLIREVVRLRKMLTEQMMAAPGIGTEVVVEGVVGMKDGRPWVHVRAGEAAWQWTPEEARQHSTIVLERAIEADRDAALIAFMRDELGADEQAAGAMLSGMREHRTVFIEGRESETS